MRHLLTHAVWALIFVGIAVGGEPRTEEELLAEAKKFHAEHSYKRVLPPLQELLKRYPKTSYINEVQFYMGDALSRINDRRKYGEAEKALKVVADGKEDDIWRARAKASLARLYTRWDWHRRRQAVCLYEDAEFYLEKRIKGEATAALKTELAGLYLEHMSAFLQYYGWHGQPKMPVVRQQMEKPPRKHPHQWRFAPESLLKKLLALKVDKKLEAQAYYVCGGRSPNYLEIILEKYPDSDYWDDAVNVLAGRRAGQQKFVEAIKLYERLIARFKESESRWVKTAKNQIREIRAPRIEVSPRYISLPGNDHTVGLRWRNAKKVTFSLYASDPVASGANSTNPFDHVVGTQGKLLKTWTEKLTDKGQHHWHNRQEEIDTDKPGCYLLKAEVAGASNRQYLLTTGMTVLTKCARGAAVVYCADCETGEPMPNAQVNVRYTYYDGRQRWKSASGEADADGVFRFTIDTPVNRNPSLLAIGRSGKHVAFSTGRTHWHGGQRQGLYAYAYTDRPVYRPSETVHFKAIFRNYDGRNFNTLAGSSVRVTIHDTKGTKLYEKNLTANDYGSVSGNVTLGVEPPLGQYRIYMRAGAQTAQANFRVEEYKRPEFEVSIATAKSIYRVGDKLEVTVSADYYFGGPVPEADTHVLVYERPYYYWHAPYREYAWYFQDIDRHHWHWHHYGRGRLVKRVDLKTDENGKVTFAIDTPQANRDYAYRIEARVVDKSRREIRSVKEVKVTRQPFYVYVRPKNYIYRPGDRVEAEIVAKNASGQSVETSGMVQVQMAKYSRRSSNYEYKDVEAGKFATTADGTALFAFTPDEIGYYRLLVTAFGEQEEKVTGEGWVWVASKENADTAYRYRGVQVITDKDTYVHGETAHVMLVSHYPDSYVLFGIEGHALHDCQLVHIKERSRLIDVPIKEEHEPNVFLTACAVRDLSLLTHTKQVIVPPVDKFVNVEITSDKKVYQPGEVGTFAVKASDHKDEPVVCEVSLGLVDSSIYYIQSEYASDIRQFFYGQKRQQKVHTATSFNMMRYLPQKKKPKDQEKQRDEMPAAEGGAAEEEAKEVADDAAAAPGAARRSREAEFSKGKKSAGAGAAAPLAEATVRKDFRATAFW